MRKEFASWIIAACGLCTVGCGGTGTTAVTAGGSSAAASPTAAGTPATPVATTTGTGGTSGASADGGTAAPSPGTEVEPQWNIEVSGTTDPLLAVWGSGHTSVWAVGPHSILRSAGDGGWTLVRGGDSDQYTTVFAADDAVFVAGMRCDAGLCDGGMLLRSTDDGATWTRSGLTAAAYNFARGADGTLYLAVDGGALASTDRFATSTMLAVSSLPATRGIFAGGDGSLLALGGIRSFEIRRSGDGGTSWASSFSGGGGSQSGYVDAAWSAGDANVYAVANASDVPRAFGRLLRSTDAGQTFAPATLPDLDDANGVWGSGANDVYIAGSQLLHSGDGSTFAAVTLPATVDWSAVWGSDAANVYVVGAGGTIVHLH
jgi:hypothetical protein